MSSIEASSGVQTPAPRDHEELIESIRIIICEYNLPVFKLEDIYHVGMNMMDNMRNLGIQYNLDRDRLGLIFLKINCTDYGKLRYEASVKPEDGDILSTVPQLMLNSMQQNMERWRRSCVDRSKYYKGYT